MRARSFFAVACVGSALLVAPASGQAAQTFGSNLISSPDKENCSPSCTLWNAALHSANTQGTLTAPSDGVVVGFTIKKGAVFPGQPWARLHLRIVKPMTTPSDTLWQGLGASSPDVTPSDSIGLEAFSARLPVKAGDFLAMELPDGGYYYNRGNGVFGATRRAANPVVASGCCTATSSYNAEVLLQARLEPDADKDGFGDESQDKCLGKPGTVNGCPSAKKCKKKKKKGKGAAAAKKKKCKKRKRKKEA